MTIYPCWKQFCKDKLFFLSSRACLNSDFINWTPQHDLFIYLYWNNPYIPTIRIFYQVRVMLKYKCSPDFPGGSDGKESVCSAGNPGSSPGSGRSPGKGNGNPLQYSCLENSMDRGASWGCRVRHYWVTNTHIINIQKDKSTIFIYKYKTNIT